VPRYDIQGGEDAQYEPGSEREVLRNLLGVVQRQEMDVIEFQALVAAKDRFFEHFDMDAVFTTETLLTMHRSWLGSIYAFAGRLRSVDIAKGNVWFAAAQFLEETFARFGRETLERRTPCSAGSIGAVAAAIAEVHGELISVHPFREGNGRIARWLSDAMAAQAGLPFPNYGFTDRAEGEQNARYLAAVKRSVSQADHAALTQFFAEALERAL
jgi:cell filamentation protein